MSALEKFWFVRSICNLFLPVSSSISFGCFKTHHRTVKTYITVGFLSFQYDSKVSFISTTFLFSQNLVASHAFWCIFGRTTLVWAFSAPELTLCFTNTDLWSLNRNWRRNILKQWNLSAFYFHNKNKSCRSLICGHNKTGGYSVCSCHWRTEAKLRHF